LDELPAADLSKYTNIVNEVTTIMQNATVQALARINDDVKQLLDDADEIMSITDRPISWKTVDFVARSQDVILNQVDASPDSYRVMSFLLDDDDEASESEEEDEPPEITRLDYKSQISDQALPSPWSQPTAKNTFMHSELRVTLPGASISMRRDRAVGLDRESGQHILPGIKGKFSQQVAALKNMGFGDEKKILQALRETGGNLQLAVKLLQDKFFM
jgi:hypothetical protein